MIVLKWFLLKIFAKGMLSPVYAAQIRFIVHCHAEILIGSHCDEILGSDRINMHAVDRYQMFPPIHS